MRKIIIMLWWTLLLSFTLLPAAAISAPLESESVLVGRVSHVEGELLHYVPETEDWVAVVQDAPFGLDDALYSGEDGRAEFILPNRTRIRMGGATQIQLITLKEDLTQVDVASGIARFYNNSDDGIIKVTTPFGDVIAESSAQFDLYVGERSVEVVSLEGVVEYALEKKGTRYEVEPASSILSDGDTVTDAEGTVDSAWQSWNEERDSLWAKRTEVKGESVSYLPDGLRDEAYALEENGRWERVPYEGETRALWRPNNVDAEWEPFSAGRWATYHGDNTWIPEDEPFGYVTHHYGNWVYLDAPRAWYWAPPVAVAAVAPPAIGVSFSWYPGRVGWIHSGINVGWFPLAPFEPFYAHRFWGPRTVVVRNVRRVNININRFTNVRRAVIINRRDFFAARNFRNVRIRDFNRTTITRNFRSAPFITDRVIPNFSRNRQRFQFANINVNRVPHRVVVQRIRQNRQAARRLANLRARTVERNLRSLRAERAVRTASIERPRAFNRLVARNEARKTRRQVRFEQRELKREARQLERVAERRQKARELRQQRLQARERVRTERQGRATAGQLREQRRDRAQRAQQLRQQRQQRRERARELRQQRQDGRQKSLEQRRQQRRQQRLRQQSQERRERIQAQRQQRARQLRQQQRQQRLEQRRQQRLRQQRQERRQRIEAQRQQRARQLRQQQRQQRIEQRRQQRLRQQRQERRQRIEAQRQQRARQLRQQQRQQRLEQRRQRQRQQRQGYLHERGAPDRVVYVYYGEESVSIIRSIDGVMQSTHYKVS
jgi:hypothetical protein